MKLNKILRSNPFFVFTECIFKYTLEALMPLKTRCIRHVIFKLLKSSLHFENGSSRLLFLTFGKWAQQHCCQAPSSVQGGGFGGQVIRLPYVSINLQKTIWKFENWSDLNKTRNKIDVMKMWKNFENSFWDQDVIYEITNENIYTVELLQLVPLLK